MELKKVSITENQRKVIEDKYLKDSPSIEAWLDLVTNNITLAELLHAPEIKEEDIFKDVKYSVEEFDTLPEQKAKIVLLHKNFQHYDEWDANFKIFMNNLYKIADTEKGKSIVEPIREKFYNMLSNFEFLPNSPTLMNAGRRLQQLSACYVLPVGDSIEEIFESVKHAAIVHKSGGGTGFSFSRLRPSNDEVKSTHGIASGPLTFMQIFDKQTDVVRQGGVRRGANMGILRYNHPDIMGFINMKKTPGVMENFNVSVSITKEFMDKVKKNEDYDLINPRTKEAVGKLNAREVWNEMIKGAWETGDPGFVVIDRINETNSNPTPYIGEIESTNPCLSSDSMIFTDTGISFIKDLPNHNPGIKVLTDLRSINSKGSLFTDAYAIPTGQKKIYRISLKNGMFIDATEEHKILTEKGFIKVKDLKPREKVCIHIEDISTKWSGNVTRDIAQILGWLTGDGWVYNDSRYSSRYMHYGFIFSGKDSLALEIVKKTLSNFNVPFKQRYNKGCEEVVCYGHRASKFFDQFNILPEKEKSVPLAIFNGGRDGIIGYLQGLFSSDGHVANPIKNRRRIILTSVSLKLLHQVQVLLTSLGIYSSIRMGSKSKGIKYSINKVSKTRQRYDLYITAASFHQFLKLIGFPLSQKKQEKAERISKLTKNLKFSKSLLQLSSITDITPLGTENVYDIVEHITHSFIANGICVHNCGEQPLLPYEPCNLGSINLSKFVKEDGSDMDWPRLKQNVFDCVHFLDNVIDVNNYPIPQIEYIAKTNRRIGLGVMGLAETLVMLSIPYNDEKAFAKAEEIMKFINENALLASEELAEIRGVFPNWKNCIFDKNGQYFRGQEAYPRNSARTTIAPTGTIGITAGLQGAGIEPFFAIAYVRYNAAGIDALKKGQKPLDKDTFYEINPLFKQIAEKDNYFGFEEKELWQKIEDNHKSIVGIKEIPENIQKLFLTSHDLAPLDHVNMQCAFQKYVDNAVSKTVNLRNEATIKDVEEVYMKAYEFGAKGVTIYRDGSKQFQILNLKDKVEKKTKEKRGYEMSDYYEVPTGQGPLHVHINYDKEGPTKVFANISPIGTEISGLTMALGIILSKYLEIGGDPARLIKHLNSIKGDKPYGFGPQRVDSIPHGISKVFRQHLIKTGRLKHLDGQKVLSEQTTLNGQPLTNLTQSNSLYCPKCFSTNVMMVSGCSEPTCVDCGYSECG